MSELLAQVRSSSNPTKLYSIRKGDDGVIYCDCWVWKRTRKCKHLAEYHSTVRHSATPVVEPEPEPQSVTERLKAALPEALALFNQR